jgi:ribose/xylose/arabinose/galactoside ABC-type transport system permease subunit
MLAIASMSRRPETSPPIVLTYGLLGILPFLAPAAAGYLRPEYSAPAAGVLVFYAGLILSFLGGARWGLAVSQAEPPAPVISLAMIPTLAGLALLVLPPDNRRIQIPGLLACLMAQWLWDITSHGLPLWYPRLRSVLTAGAAAGLLAGAVLLT